MPSGVYERTAKHREIASAGAKKGWANPDRRVRGPRTPEMAEKIAASLRGRYPGERNPAWKGEAASYWAVHTRARTALVGEPCSLADESCRGVLEAAFRHDADSRFVRYLEDGRAYFVGDNPRDGYRILCRSHHRREDHARRSR
jgi:hypothetical protein